METENFKMKNPLISLMIISTLFFVINCTPQKIQTENINREWMLVEFQNFNKDLMIKNNAKLDLSKTTNSAPRFTATMGCNGIFGQATFKANGKVVFSAIGSTEMFCAENMNLETEFVKVLPTITTYKVEGHRLTLSKKDGTRLKFVASDWD